MTPPREPRTEPRARDIAVRRLWKLGAMQVDAAEALMDKVEAEAAGARLREALVDEALQYALAFPNDPEGLSSAREEWRDKVRDALTAYRAATPAPAPLDVEALGNAIAYALARADLPVGNETSRAYAERLAPLVIESGWLTARAAAAEDV